MTGAHGWVAAALVLLCLAVYAPVRHHAFVNYDDRVAIVENPNLVGGLSLASVRKAFAEPRFYNYIPLTAVSLQVDHALHGLEPAGYLLTNVALHAATCVLLFFALAAMTGLPIPSAFVAAVFAVHPLHVESVAWATARKDVLSGLFFAAALLGWAAYVRRPGPVRYAAVAVAFGLGLLAKPVVVTLPCVLLLLDWWPLGRLRDRASALRLLLEKLPLFALAAAGAAWTYVVQQHAGGVSSVAALPFELRLLNALDSYAIYAFDSVGPSGLAVFYPHPRDAVSVLRAALAGLGLLIVTAAVLRAGRDRGYLAVGWLWYLGTLVPVIGLVQAGMQARADRYMYWPLAGLALMAAFLAADAARGSRRIQRALCALGLAAVLALAGAASRQVATWRDTESLFLRALAVTEGNFVAHNGLAAAYREAGRHEEAIVHYREALRLHPGLVSARVGLADALLATGRRDEALAAYRAALADDPADARGRSQLAKALAESGAFEQAEAELRRSLALEPEIGVAQVETNLGTVLLALRRPDEAALHYRRALERDPARDDARRGLARSHVALGEAAAARGALAEAVEHQRTALSLTPSSIAAINNLAWLLATASEPALRSPGEAVTLAERALALRGARDPALLDTLAAAQAAAGRPDAAVRIAREAVARARSRGDEALAGQIEQRLALYGSGRAYVERGPG
jgi:tetratricopeptide (TPR) repeat protein